MPQAIAYALRYTATPALDEDWITQLRRSSLAIAHAFKPESEHEQSLRALNTTSMPGRAAMGRAGEAKRTSMQTRRMRRASRRT